VETSGLAIQTQPQSQTNIVGTTATFNVTAVGESPLTYQWRFNNTNINAATNFTFVKSNVQLTNSGNYRVVVSNPSGSITSAVAVLKVLAPVTLEMPSLLNETNFFFRFQSVTGQTYILQYKDALSDPNWISLKTNAGTGKFLTNILPIAGTTNRFFRSLSQ
jgi:hypothetical protein